MLGAPRDVVGTDLMSVREKDNSSGEWKDVKITHINYLREKYGGVYPPLLESEIEKVPMIACQLVGRKRASMKSSKTVHIPATLLQLVNVDSSDFTKALREEITRMSQRTSDQVVSELNTLSMELTNPRIQDTFQLFGLALDPAPKKVSGNNRLAHTVVVSLTPNENSLTKELRLEPQTGSFEYEFQRVNANLIHTHLHTHSQTHLRTKATNTVTHTHTDELCCSSV